MNIKIAEGGESVSIVSGALEVIDIAHAEIHEGQYYTANKLFKTVANGSFSDIHLVTGATKYPNMVLTVQAEAKSYVSIYRGTTYTGIGTTLTIANNNGNSTNTTESAAYYTPTVNALGTLMYEDFVAAGSGSRRVGADLSSRSEWILRPSTDYLVRVQNVGGSGVTSDTAITLSYYENTISID